MGIFRFNSPRFPIVLPLVIISVTGCARGTSISDQYIPTLEQLVSTQAKTDGDKQAIMVIYRDLGGADSSRQRANQTCEVLRSGKVIEEVTQQQSLRVVEDLHLNGLGRAWNDEEMTRINHGTNLYLAEVFAAQTAICPETKVDLKL